nr:unnamed protein product [Callosobruchus chinensis]
MNNQALPRSHSFKLLGVSITENMIWHEHVSSIATAAGKKLGYLFRARKYFSPSYLLTLYKAQIRPSLEYCSHIWGAAAPTTLSILDAVQRRAIRLIAGLELQIPCESSGIDVKEKYQCQPRNNIVADLLMKIPVKTKILQWKPFINIDEEVFRSPFLFGAPSEVAEHPEASTPVNDGGGGRGGDGGIDDYLSSKTEKTVTKKMKNRAATAASQFNCSEPQSDRPHLRKLLVQWN